jgi:hypothetical protein
MNMCVCVDLCSEHRRGRSQSIKRTDSGHALHSHNFMRKGNKERGGANHATHALGSSVM